MSHREEMYRWAQDQMYETLVKVWEKRMDPDRAIRELQRIGETVERELDPRRYEKQRQDYDPAEIIRALERLTGHRASASAHREIEEATRSKREVDRRREQGAERARAEEILAKMPALGGTAGLLGKK